MQDNAPATPTTETLNCNAWYLVAAKIIPKNCRSRAAAGEYNIIDATILSLFSEFSLHYGCFNNCIDIRVNISFACDLLFLSVNLFRSFMCRFP